MEKIINLIMIFIGVYMNMSEILIISTGVCWSECKFEKRKKWDNNVKLKTTVPLNEGNGKNPRKIEKCENLKKLMSYIKKSQKALLADENKNYRSSPREERERSL